MLTGIHGSILSATQQLKIGRFINRCANNQNAVCAHMEYYSARKREVQTYAIPWTILEISV